MGDELHAAVSTGRHLEHVAVHEAKKHPGPGKTQDWLVRFLGDVLLSVQHVSLDERRHATNGGALDQGLVDAEKNGRVDIVAPGREPVDRKWEHALRGRATVDLAVQTRKTFVTELSLVLEDLQPRPQPDHGAGQRNVVTFLEHALVGRYLGILLGLRLRLGHYAARLRPLEAGAAWQEPEPEPWSCEPAARRHSCRPWTGSRAATHH